MNNGKHYVTIDQRNGDRVCEYCGLVVGKCMSDLPDWFESDKARASQDTFTQVGPKGSYLNKLNLSINRDQLTNDDGADFIQRLCSELELDANVSDRAIYYLDMITSTNGVWRGNRRVALRAACVSIACQQLSVGLKDDELCQAACVKQNMRVLNRQKKIAISRLYDMGIRQHHLMNASEFCYRCCSRIGCDRRTTAYISRLVNRIQNTERLQSKPCIMISVVIIIHVFSNEGIILNKDLICELSGVTMSTVIKWYSDVLECDLQKARLHCIGNAS